MKAIPIGVCCIKKVVADDMKSATTWKSTTILIEYARFCRVHFYHNECIARMISISISISRML